MKQFIMICLLMYAYAASAQESKDSDLFRALKIQDSIFFERGFNLCDMEYLQEHIAADLRFYHDQGGFQNRDAFFESVQKNICSGAQKKPIRKVESNSLEVFPLYQNGKLYGAIQSGIHHFYLSEMHQTDVYTSTARFTHVWTLENEVWKLSEVLSYDHHQRKE